MERADTSPPASAGMGDDPFPDTRWTLVQRAAETGQPTIARRALGELLQSYWYPLYAYARRHGSTKQDAEDATQGFLAHLIEKDVLEKVAEERGKLRAYLLVSFKRFLTNTWRKANAAKRGGGTAPLSIDADWAEGQLAAEPASQNAGPDELYDRAWASALIDSAFAALRERYTKEGKAELFDGLRTNLWGDTPQGLMIELAEKCDMSHEAVRTAARRLRKRFREALEAQVADTVADPESARQELAHLRAALTTSR